MMQPVLLPVLFGALAALAPHLAAQFTPPTAGVIRTAAGQLRIVHGVSGNFVAGDVLRVVDVLASTFDSSGGLIHVEGAVLQVDRSGAEVARHEVPEGPAILSASGRAAYFVENHSVLSFAGAVRQTALPEVEGTVLALSASAIEISLAVRSKSGEAKLLRFDARGFLTGTEALPGTGGPILLLSAGLVYVEDRSIIWLDFTSGVERRWNLDSAPATLLAMGEGWLQAGEWAVRLDRDPVFALPAVGEEPATRLASSAGRGTVR
ncbi:MAG: hypothetical protein ABI823_04810 [Bryobacteraceae bacterium]